MTAHSPTNDGPYLASIPKRVAKGVAWLDANRPGWQDKIEVVRLSMPDSCRCVLGQVFAAEAMVEDPFTPYAGFDYALNEVVTAEEYQNADHENWADLHGFDLPVLANEADWDELQAEWERVIAERRAGR